MYRALRDCKFDKKYSYGENIPDSVADQGCFANAIKFGYIEKVETVEEPEMIEETETVEEPEMNEEPVEAQETPESDSDKEAEEEPKQKRGGRKKADRGV